MLNLVNNVHDDKAEYLRNVDISTDNIRRYLDLYVSHNDQLIAIGYENDNLVWFSQTKTSDMLLSRRIFESMRQSCFYRRVKLDDILCSVNMTLTDLQYMCYAKLDEITTDHPVFSGCIKGNDGNFLTGLDFANIIAVLPSRLKNSIVKIGSEDDIIAELEKDRRLLDTYVLHEGKQCKKITEITDKWRGAECLKLCDRASVRSLYHDICYFETGE